MKETLILTRILFKNSSNKNVNKDQTTFKAIAGKLILFLAIAYIACVVGFLSKEFISILQEANQTQLFITLVLLVSIGVSLFQSILASLNVLYFSKDIEFLLPLPISSSKIVFSKFNVMILSGYLMEIITFAIPFIVYGVMTEAEPIFFAISALVFFLIPIIPTLLGILITVILMNFTNIFSNKDVVQYLTVFITFALIIGMQIFLGKTSDITEFMLVNKLMEIDGLSNIISKHVIILKQAITALTEVESIEAIRNILFLFGESITAYIIVGFLTAKTYIKSATNVVSGKSIKVNTKIKANKIKSQRKAYIEKEFKMLFRTPAFFLNTVLPILILPILIAIPILTSGDGINKETLNALKIAGQAELTTSMGFGIILCIINFLYMFNYVAVTAISRDGENALFMKYIPIELHKQCRYKAIPAILLNILPLAFITVSLKIVFTSLDNIFLLEIVLVGLLCNFFISYAEILIDLLKPKIHWTTEYSVVKQNLNMLWDAIFNLVVIICIFAICSFFESVHIVAFLLSSILIITTLFYDGFLKQNSTNIFKKIC